MLERLQKVLARAGVASRRHCEELITKGKIRVNGKVVTELGTKVNPLVDKIEVDGKPLPQEQQRVYFLLNKPGDMLLPLKMKGVEKPLLNYCLA
ncbi:hypothetical protein N752_22260 [Desulforamulus aquiferis]|nr:hypothetical protein N752_22260 [Desulforamulus aquiferis]